MGLLDAAPSTIQVIYPACRNLAFLNLSYASIQSWELAELQSHCPYLRRLWVLDTVEDKELEAVGSNCPLLEELRVFPTDPYDEDAVHGVTQSGVVVIVKNCPDFTDFRLCSGQPDYLTNEPMDEAFGSVVKTCFKLRRLRISGLLTDLMFEYIGKYAENLETLSVAFAGCSDWGMQCVLGGCPTLKKLEIRYCPFGNAALLYDLEKSESMQSLWMLACKVAMNGCRLLAREMLRLNVEVIENSGSDENQAKSVYVYRSVAGPTRDAPPFVVTL